MFEKKADKNEKITEALKILIENGDLFFEDYQGKISPITYYDMNDGKIIFKE